MKVLFWTFIGFDRHTTSRHLLSAMLEQLCIAGHTVHILQKDTGGSLPAIPESISGYPVTTDVMPFQAADKSDFISRYLTELKYIRACRKKITSDYDAVFVQSNNEAGFVLRAIRKKLPRTVVTFNVQDIFPDNAVYSGSIKKNSPVFKVLAAIQRYAYRRADHIITISEDMKETLQKDGVPSEKIEVVYNLSYQDDLYKNVDTVPVSNMFDQNYFNVVYAGNIGVMQNVDLLIDTAAVMKEETDIWFHIIGNGARKEKLQAKAKTYGIHNISFWPMQPPELAPAVYCTADINVIPLVRDVFRTALPSKTATCLACQKPVIFAIGKDSIFARKAMEQSGCPVIEADRPEELADTIRRIKNKEMEINTGAFFLENFKKTDNSRKYAEIIVRK